MKGLSAERDEVRAEGSGRVGVPPRPGGRRPRVPVPLIAMLMAVGTALGGCLVGFGHLGNDPDRSTRNIKIALARALARGELPFWAEEFGLGSPLAAESHVAAFYPPNWPAYSALETLTAFDLLMWLHYLGMAASTYLLARVLGATPWGSALAGVAYALSGHVACHSVHEPFYNALAYLPLALAMVERLMATGRAIWAVLLALALGVELTVGHFQYQFYTILAALFLAAWRTLADGRPWRRLAGVVGALAWGFAIAGIQMALTAEIVLFTKLRMEKTVVMATLSYPPWHAVELALPLMFARVPGAYWNTTQATYRQEACLYVGTAALILAIVGLMARGRSRSFAPWLVLGVLGLALPAMTRLWLRGYMALLELPGFGQFRCPGRYTIFTTLALCLLAGAGLDRAIDARTFRRGLIAAAVAFVVAVAWAVGYAALPRYRPYLWDGRLATTIGVGALSWASAVAALIAWRRGTVGAWAPLVVLAAELGVLFYVGTGEWGWHEHPERGDTVLGRLALAPGVGRVGGDLFDVPIRAGLTPANPYLS
ncbi:MAG TPA: YfhO family protein, partial [Isosphaeraceae bacterium]